jgi:hypothetical protein
MIHENLLSAVRLAQAVIRRDNAQPIPLSQEETTLLARAVLHATAHMDITRHGSVVVSDDPHDQAQLLLSRNDDDDTKANTRQVAGSHYGLSSFQHWDVVALFKLDYFQGQVTKYVMRWREKNGVQDLQKAAHFLEKYIEVIIAEKAKESAA